MRGTGDGAERLVSVGTSAGSEDIQVIEHGEGPVWAVAWHGLAFVNRMAAWELLLPDRGTLVCAGLPGHGVPSGRVTRRPAWTPREVVDMCGQVLQKVAGDRPVVLVGASLGGGVALGVAAQAPQRSRGLILVAPLVWGATEGLVKLWGSLSGRPRLCEAAFAATLAPGRRHPSVAGLSARALVADWEAFRANPHVTQAQEAGHPDFCRTSNRVLAATARVVRDWDLRPTLTAAPPSVPTLILHGTRDPIVRYEQAQWLAAALPRATLVPLPRVGHLPQAECEELVARLMRDWTDEELGSSLSPAGLSPARP